MLANHMTQSQLTLVSVIQCLTDTRKGHTGLLFDLTDRNTMMDTRQLAAVYVLQLVGLSGTMHTYH